MTTTAAATTTTTTTAPAAAAAPATPLPTAKNIKRMMARAGVQALSKPMVDELVILIREQAEKVRTLKAGGQQKSDPTGFWTEVFRLLRLKYNHNINSGAGKVEDEMAVPMRDEGNLVTTIKLRWKVRDPTTGGVVRLQRPLMMRTTVSGREIREAVVEYTRIRFPTIGAPVKIELPASSFGIQTIQTTTEASTPDAAPPPAAAAAAAAPAVAGASSSTLATTPAKQPKHAVPRRAIADGDMFYLPLCFPGPRLANTWTPELRVTFPEVATNEDTPREYEGLGEVPELIDVGVNLTDPGLKGDVAGVVHRAAVAGVSTLVTLGVDVESTREGVELAERFAGTVYATAGVHPSNAGKGDLEEAMKAIEEIVRKARPGRIVAIGEIGLDFGVGGGRQAAREVQVAWFERQLKMATELGLPVIIHDRAAFADVIAVIDRIGGGGGDRRGGIVNCFNGTAEQMEAFIERGFMIGLTGLLCNDARAEAELRPAVSSGGPTHVERLVLGSDAPYLTPFNMEKPFPPKNEPRTLPHVAAMVSKVVGRPIGEVARMTTANARRVLGIGETCFDGRHGVRPYASSPNAMRMFSTKQGERTDQAPLTAAEVESLKLLKEGEEMFEHSGKIFACGPRDKDVLESQQKKLDPESFSKLVADFKLRELRRPTGKERKRKGTKDRGRTKTKRGGHGHRGGMGGRGRGRGAGAAAPVPISPAGRGASEPAKKPTTPSRH